MNIVSIGGGPAGLYFGILMKKAFPDSRIRIIERNRPDDTFGWGVVFSKETLQGLDEADAESYKRITDEFIYWDDIETYYGGECTTSTGHGFCGMSRKRLLNILQERCTELGVELEFEREVKSPDEFPDADLILAADGVNSAVRDLYAEHFKPSLDWRKCRFTWLGTTLPMEAFTFIFKANEHGLFTVHAYPFEEGTGTFIVECHEDTWRNAGLDEATEEETVAYCEKLFADDLKGHRLLNNKSVWRSFPTIKNEKWHHGKVVLMGDAVHTAHFSIGSGTKLAMEDAIALVDAFKEHGTADVPKVLAAYQDAHLVDTIKLQKAAQTSLEWFENAARYTSQHPLQFKFNLMTRSKRITYDNLNQRDPDLVRRVTDWYREDQGGPESSDGVTPPPMFMPYRIGEMDLVNRIVVSPMCQYSAVDGTPNDWHLVHLGSRAIGGAGLVITEMTDVSAAGRITKGCAGLYDDKHVDSWKRITDFVHQNSRAKVAVQLAHAGRKGSCHHPWEGWDRPLTDHEGAWETLAPSPLAYAPEFLPPREMTREDMDTVRDDFASATRRAEQAGFDMIEVHMAHGYLLSTFITPLANQRTDGYGGSLENRMRFPLEVLRACREAWPAEKPVAVRISAHDWAGDEGITGDDAVEIARMLQQNGCDIVDVSSGGTDIKGEPEFGRMFQVPFADRIRHETGIPVMAVGAIQGWDHANTILAAGRADLAVMARPHLFNPYLTLHAAAEYEVWDQPWPGPYDPVKPRPKES
ncbi:MAG: bifunctional salicylyl-CoA 5-hydroxylase/oxidoreductase [Planctomycetota bacterium]|jgi:anthraniloyl-CoA monooxygenase